VKIINISSLLIFHSSFFIFHQEAQTPHLLAQTCQWKSDTPDSQTPLYFCIFINRFFPDNTTCMVAPKLILIPLIITYFSLFYDAMPASDSTENPKGTVAADTSDMARLNKLADLAKKYSSDKTTFQEAGKYADEALRLASEKGLPIPYKLHWAQADILYFKQDYDKACKEMAMTCDMLKTTDNYQELAEANNQLARLTGYIGNFTAAIDLYNKNIILAEEKKLKSVIPYAYRGIANIYTTLNKTEEIKKYTHLFLLTSQQENDIEGMAQAYSWLGEISLMTDSNYLQAVNYNQQAWRYENNKTTPHTSLCFWDSLKNQKYDLGIAQARTKYEAETKARDLELLSLKYHQQRYLVYGFAGLIALVLVIGVLIVRQSRINSRRRISEMNHKISEMTQANLRQQMNPHFIFNTLNSIQYYMYQHDKIATNNYLTKFSSLIRKTLENSQHTAIPIKDELDALQLYLELETLRFKDKEGKPAGTRVDIHLPIMS
jgi:hypothetical protein